ncbi:hypothetical protein LTR84_007653 [Exophiala bonariae]|uniref:Apple domain-containing protein n=1 Tax=Exophiala bonariae TaxID=1690606 RepID=A0AAV9NMB9_9EURO|nr:hypothetical protein LTR84_007653 [Exophiala bonariae]
MSTYRNPPNYANLASTRYAAAPSATNSGGGILCANTNVKQNQGSEGINPGDFNLRKVALDDAPNVVYEIECYQAPATGFVDQSGTYFSFEHCIQKCTSVACQAAQWVPTTKLCRLATTQRVNTPNSMVFGAYSARLITTANPKVISGSYLLPNNTNLGLCLGPSPGNYDRAEITVYSRTNTLRDSVTFPVTGRYDSYRVDCLGKAIGMGTNPQDEVALSATYGFYPQNADDCARLCITHSIASADGNTNSAVNCRAWYWYDNNSCKMYATKPGNAATAAFSYSGLLAAGWSRANSGHEFTAANVNAYKRSLDPFRDDTTSKRGRRALKSKAYHPVPVVDRNPDSMVPDDIIPFMFRVRH